MSVVCACSKTCTHYGPKQPRIQTEVLGHSLVRSLIRSHRSLVCLLRTARFARAHRYTHSLAHSLAHGKVNDWMPILSVFFSICLGFPFFLFRFSDNQLGDRDGKHIAEGLSVSQPLLLSLHSKTDAGKTFGATT